MKQVGRRRAGQPGRPVVTRAEDGQAVVEFVIALWAMMLLTFFMVLLFGFAQDVFDQLNLRRAEMLADYRQPEQYLVPQYRQKIWRNQNPVRVEFRDVPLMGRFVPDEEYVRPEAGQLELWGGTKEDVSFSSLLSAAVSLFNSHGADVVARADIFDSLVDCSVGGLLALTFAKSKNKIAYVRFNDRLAALGAGASCILVSGMQELSREIQ